MVSSIRELCALRDSVSRKMRRGKRGRGGRRHGRRKEQEGRETKGGKTEEWWSGPLKERRTDPRLPCDARTVLFRTRHPPALPRRDGLCLVLARQVLDAGDPRRAIGYSANARGGDGGRRTDADEREGRGCLQGLGLRREVREMSIRVQSDRLRP